MKLLALAPAHRLHREQVMDVLWPEPAPVAAAANLRKALHFSRHAIAEDGESSLIAAEGDVLFLPPEGLRIDVAGWRALAAQDGRR